MVEDTTACATACPTATATAATDGVFTANGNFGCVDKQALDQRLGRQEALPADCRKSSEKEGAEECVEAMEDFVYQTAQIFIGNFMAKGGLHFLVDRQ